MRSKEQSVTTARGKAFREFANVVQDDKDVEYGWAMGLLYSGSFAWVGAMIGGINIVEGKPVLGGIILGGSALLTGGAVYSTRRLDAVRRRRSEAFNKTGIPERIHKLAKAPNSKQD